MTLFLLDSNDPNPAAVRMRVSRPVTAPDVYFVGEGLDVNDDLVAKFQVFDIARLGRGSWLATFRDPSRQHEIRA